MAPVGEQSAGREIGEVDAQRHDPPCGGRTQLDLVGDAPLGGAGAEHGAEAKTAGAFADVLVTEGAAEELLLHGGRRSAGQPLRQVA